MTGASGYYRNAIARRNTLNRENCVSLGTALCSLLVNTCSVCVYARAEEEGSACVQNYWNVTLEIETSIDNHKREEWNSWLDTLHLSIVKGFIVSRECPA